MSADKKNDDTLKTAVENTVENNAENTVETAAENGGARNANARERSDGKKSGNKRRAAYFCVIVALIAVLSLYEIFFSGWCADKAIAPSVDAVITRSLGSVAAALLIQYLGYRVAGKATARGLFKALPCLIVALCNPPILSLIVKQSSLNVAGKTLFYYALIFAAECFFVALFEELLFRGAVFLSLLEGRRANGRQIFYAGVLSSAVFGLTHLINLISSAPGAVLLQVGYSFLLGGMCAFTLLCTKNIFFSAAVHAVFNFCGQLTERFGQGVWNTPAVMAFTVCLGVCAAAYIIYKFLRF
ncbi:MAG: lysostaphin resistance A-like protein, partial [Candidatus Scatosoma sp.]